MIDFGDLHSTNKSKMSSVHLRRWKINTKKCTKIANLLDRIWNHLIKNIQIKCTFHFFFLFLLFSAWTTERLVTLGLWCVSCVFLFQHMSRFLINCRLLTKTVYVCWLMMQYKMFRCGQRKGKHNYISIYANGRSLRVGPA